MTDGQVSLTRDHHCEEHRGAEADVVEGVGELRDQVDPDQAVLWPRPGEHYTKIKYLNVWTQIGLGLYF